MEARIRVSVANEYETHQPSPYGLREETLVDRVEAEPVELVDQSEPVDQSALVDQSAPVEPAERAEGLGRAARARR